MPENGLDQALLAHKAWLHDLVPEMPEEVCDQLAALYPLQVVPKAAPGIYIDRVAVIPSAVAYRDQKTGVRYVALTWPASTGRYRVLRLYVDFPTYEQAFLVERSFSSAREMLDTKPGLPFFIKRGIEDFIKLYTPKPTPA